MELHEAKARHAGEKLEAARYHHHGHLGQPTPAGTGYVQNQPVVGGTYGQRPVGTAAPMAGATAPAYPPGGHPPGRKYMQTYLFISSSFDVGSVFYSLFFPWGIKVVG